MILFPFLYSDVNGNTAEQKPSISRSFPVNQFMTSFGQNQNQSAFYPNGFPILSNTSNSGLYSYPTQSYGLQMNQPPRRIGPFIFDEGYLGYPEKTQSTQKIPWNISGAMMGLRQINQPSFAQSSLYSANPFGGFNGSMNDAIGTNLVPSSQQAPKIPPRPKPPRIPNEPWVPPARTWGGVNMLLGI